MAVFYSIALGFISCTFPQGCLLPEMDAPLWSSNVSCCRYIFHRRLERLSADISYAPDINLARKAHELWIHNCTVSFGMDRDLSWGPWEQRLLLLLWSYTYVINGRSKWERKKSTYGVLETTRSIGLFSRSCSSAYWSAGDCPNPPVRIIFFSKR